ncbi:hypothetical protein [Streptomyces sp. NPDC006645]
MFQARMRLVPEKNEMIEPSSFTSSDLKTPLQKTVLTAGWTWRGVVTGRL